MVNNANIRKLAEQEHFHNVGTSVDQSPKLIEMKPTTATTTTKPSTTTATRAPNIEKKVKERDVKVSSNPNRPWYMEGGYQRPANNNAAQHKMSLFPEDIPNSDRIPGEDQINTCWRVDLVWGFCVVLN